jgi:hypothetical protein
MATQGKVLRGPALSTELFGGILDIDAAGHFPGLELINFVVAGTDGVLPPPEVEKVRLLRQSHHFARRLVAEGLPPEVRDEALLGPHSAEAIAQMLRCLELNTSGRRSSNTWTRTHFFPYTRSLVHWDAKDKSPRNRAVEIERVYLRGGGALAHAILRNDPDASRLEFIREGLRDLYPVNSGAPLESLAAALLKHGERDGAPREDTVEPKTKLFRDCLEDLYRSGVSNILGYRQSPGVLRIRALMDWTGIWLVLMQATRSAAYLARPDPVFVVDCAGANPQLRRASQRNLKDHISHVEDAVRAIAKVMEDEGTLAERQLSKIRGFLASTAWTCGLLNANQGRRHFTLRLPAIEALVMASIPSGEERPFEWFSTDWLGRRCRLIISREAAAASGLLDSFDASIFEENERQFAQQMRATGMLSVYSDATRMVSGDSRQ